MHSARPHKVLEAMVVAASFWLVLLGVGRRAHADELAVLELVVNTVAHEATLVRLRPDDVLVPREALEAAGLQRITARTHRLDGLEYVSMASVSPKLDWVVDEEHASLRIEAPAQAFAHHVTDLRQTAPPDLEHRRDASFFLNYAPRLVNLRRSELFAESGIGFGNHLLFSSVSATPDLLCWITTSI